MQSQPTVLITELARGGIERCLPPLDGQPDPGSDPSATRSEWLGLHPVAGFTPLRVADPRAWLAAKGQLVVIDGTPSPLPFQLPPVDRPGPCVEAQWRSDWVHAPDGIRLERAGMRLPSPSFDATFFRAWDGLVLARTSRLVEVTVRNTGLRVPLTDLVVTMHYEGCGRKPFGSEKSQPVAALAIGASVDLTFPLHNVPGADGDRAFSVQIAGGGATVAFLLDRRLADAGITVRCPPRR